MAMDAAFLKKNIGPCLAQCLAEVVEKRPADPIEYISDWLYKYVKNQKMIHEKQELEEMIEREKVEYEMDKKMQQEMKEEAARIKAVEDEKKRILEEELAKEREAANASKLATVAESQEPAAEPEKEASTEEAAAEGEGEVEGDENAEGEANVEPTVDDSQEGQISQDEAPTEEPQEGDVEEQPAE